MDNYKLIIIPFVGLILSQIIKFVLESIKYKKICLNRLFNGAGGMPSTHSTFVSSLTTVIYLEYGVYSSVFAIALIFSLIVIYDSMGVRYEAGKQAIVLNKIVKVVGVDKNKSILKEKVGHTPIEVLCGIFLGIGTSLIFC